MLERIQIGTINRKGQVEHELYTSHDLLAVGDAAIEARRFSRRPVFLERIGAPAHRLDQTQEPFFDQSVG